jgi:hypothetical protein
MAKKYFILLAIIFVIVIGGAGLGVRFFSGEDNWICQNGQWIKHGNPNAPMPITGCGEQNEEIIVNSPKVNDIITSPVSISGKVRGNWMFEASFPARVVDTNGNELGVAPLQAQENWMTTDFVNFTGQITFSNPTTTAGFLVFNNDNPSGLPQNLKEFKLPIKFGQSAETTTVKVYFNNNNLDPEASCNKVFPVDRVIPKTTAVARAALEALLAGPTTTEKASGYTTSINAGVKIQSLTIENQIARVDFDEQLEFQVGGSCRVSAIRAQITQTLKQFSTIENVIISINGRTDDILQP